MKKVLSFVLVLSLVLGSFSMAFAATPAGLSDVAGSANIDAIQVAYDLGIVTGNPDGTFLPTKAVNRAEFAAMITRAMAVPDSALAGYTSTTFKDTAGYDWAVKYLAFCETKGIILGDGQGNVMPGRTITVNEAVTMVLRAVGYTSNSNELIGAWPSNYVTLAQNLDLYDDVAAVSTVDKANAAQILYNALTLTKVVVDTEGKTTAAAGGKSLMTGNLGATVTTGATIDGSKFSNTSININGLIGKYGTKYEDKDGKLLAFDASSKALYGKMKVGSTTVFIADGVEYNLPVDSTVTVAAIKNAGTSTGDASTVTIGGILAYSDAGKVTLNVKLSGVNIEKVYNAVAWASTDDAKVTTAQLEDITAKKELLGGAFAKDKNGALDTAQFNLLGATALSAIAKDNIVYIYEDAAGKIRQVAVGTSIITGKVTSRSTVGTLNVYVGGNKYEAASRQGDRTLPALADNTSMRLDYFGDVYSFTSTDTANKYGVVVGYSTESALSNAKAKVFTSDDTSKVFDFVGNDDITADTTITGFITAGGLFKYRVDANGDIDAVVTAPAFTNSTDDSLKVLSSKVLAYGSKYYTIASDVVVFTHDGTVNNFAVAKIADVNLNTELTTTTALGASYVLNSDGYVAALLVHKNLTTTSTSDSYGVVNTVAEGKNTANKTVQDLSGFIGTTSFPTKLTDASSTLTFASGAVYAFKIDAAGVITEAKSLLSIEVTPSGVKASGYVIGANGVVISATNSDRTVLTASTSGIKIAVASDAVVYKLVVKADGTTFDKYEVGKLTDLRAGDKVWAYDTKGKDADNVATMVIYQDL